MNKGGAPPAPPIDTNTNTKGLKLGVRDDNEEDREPQPDAPHGGRECGHFLLPVSAPMVCLPL